MDKKTWYVITENDKDGGLFAYAEGITNNNNLLYYFRDPAIQTVNACDTKHDAEKIAEFWNQCYIRNGTAAKWLRPAAV